MRMLTLIFWLLSVSCFAANPTASAPTAATSTPPATSDTSKKAEITTASPVSMEGLGGIQTIEGTSSVPEFHKWNPDSAPLPRAYVQQPPLIPHQIEGYQITVKFNKCLTCHSFQNSKQSGATKISVTHFRDRDGVELDNVAPRRYFCTQCHVPQTDAKPLVENQFKPVESLR